MWSSRNKMLTDTDGDDVAFLSGSGDSRHGLYNGAKREMYENGHVAQCTKKQAIFIIIFVFTAIFLTSLAAAFVRPFNECPFEEELPVEILPSEPELIATNGEEFPWDDVRLPGFIKPIRYDIELEPNLTSRYVKGIEKLIFEVTQETNFIVFHSKNITITSRTINQLLHVERMLEFPYREQIYLETDDFMVPGKSYALRLKFQYQLSTHLEGFYLSRYKNSDGEEQLLATSHFEPTYARRAFPCFDEPDLKARFLMTLAHDENYKAFFNMPKVAVTHGRTKSNLVRDEFQETVEMSTYLVAFVVCDFDKITKNSTKGVNVSVIAAPDKIGQAQFALDSAADIMDYYDEFFGVPYPLPKEDLIAIPDFGAGAMENWGLITYRETSLLYSEKETSVDAKQWVAIVVAHELAHQWFGNLVTMKWWNDLWLNEGFASWMEYRGVDHIQPSWRMMDQFFLDMISPALSLDSLTTSHPISVDVDDPKEIEAIFDTISYKKGAAIIHMLEEAVGEKAIRDGLSYYLKQHKFGNAVTNDLWEAISLKWDREAAANDTSRINFDFTVHEMMDTWTLQMGYPLVSFVRRNETRIYTCKQEKFFKAAATNDTGINERMEEQKDYSWVIPISYTTNVMDSQYQNQHRILNKTNTFDIQLPGDMLWFKANVNGTGFYHVNYPRENWDALTLALQEDHTVFTAADRAQLINDAFSLSQAGLLPATVPLKMCIYLVKETEIVPWAAAMRHINSWRVTLLDTDMIPMIDGFILSLITPLYNSVGWEDKGEHSEKLLRKLILLTAMNAEMEEAKNKAKGLFQDYMENDTPVNPNLRSMVYTAGVRYGDKAEWQFAWQKYQNTKVPSEKSLWLRALGDSQKVYILERYLEATLVREYIRPQDATSVLSSVARNPSGYQLAWRHIQLHWGELLENFGAGSFIMGSMIESTTSHFSTEYDFKQVKEFFRTKKVGSGKRALDQSMEQIQINIQWRNDHEMEIRDWFEDHLDSYDSLFGEGCWVHKEGDGC